MYKPFLTGVLLLCSLLAHAESSVWRVSKGTDQLWIGGTVHLLPPAQYPLPAEFNAVYQQTDVLVLETDLSKMQDSSSAAMLQQYLLYPAGTTLSSKLTATTRQQLQALLQKHHLTLPQIEQFKPGMLVTQLTLLELQQQGFSSPGVDQHFLTLALQQNKTLKYLEAVEFQLKLLGDLGTGREDLFLQHALSDVEQSADLMDKTLRAWRAGDLTQVEQLVLAPVKVADAQTYQQMFVGRNQAWLPQIQALFGNKEQELVLVGLGHLAGSDGLLALLQQAGYQVEAAKAQSSPDKTTE
ncbi:TraB/GumN family protein [Rheinheimera sp. F8]|uniref:TraB/GumN family protein n=1 Tax=Rheinheimera sp. F8 TaxID=1763998 RepID=UPI00074482A0|nr:TraB/GumN family protein [Rheinheimera sp. F8]ALZ74700.1 hypothetical protein ATY27_02300 [Rheinheimera sp. F8]